MDVQQVKEDFREGRLDAEQLLDVIDALAKINQQSHAQLATANKRIEELESRIEELEKDKPAEKLDEAYSMKAEGTGWSIKSVWAFLSEQVSVCLFGVPKSGATLAAVLDKDTFLGVLVSDDAAVYQNFSKAQKCWAHLLRKAIELTLQDPENEAYGAFADTLLALYGKACRIQRDKRYTAATRERKVAGLEDELRGLCTARWLDETPTPDEAENSYRCLVSELMRLLPAKELFTFVTEAGVAGTNNEVERELRPMSQARDTGRTNKKPSGCRRQSILYSVFASLRKQLPQYTLETVVSEAQRWWTQGRSCFWELADSLGLPPPETWVLDKVLPLDSSSRPLQPLVAFMGPCLS
jgi:hypothetical protein